MYVVCMVMEKKRGGGRVKLTDEGRQVGNERGDFLHVKRRAWSISQLVTEIDERLYPRKCR